MTRATILAVLALLWFPWFTRSRPDDDSIISDCDPDSCSLYCAASPRIRVSRRVPPQAGAEHEGYLLDDGDPSTAWVVEGGLGEWFEFEFVREGMHPDVLDRDTDPPVVDRLFLMNGYGRSPSQWRNHARVRELELSIDGRPGDRFEILDRAQPQEIRLPPTPVRLGTRIRFTIRGTFAGARFDETAISAACLDGTGHH